jgi:uncharacterized protein
MQECRPETNPPSARSMDVFVVPLEQGKSIIYAPLRRAAFIGNDRVAEVIRDLRSGNLIPGADDDSALMVLLRKLGIVGGAPEIRPHGCFSGEPQPTSITLFLTTECNLRCRYCYASSGAGKPRFMRLETAMRGIDFVVANAVRKHVKYVEVGYHGGGEPTLHWSVLTESVSYAKARAAEAGMTLQATLATNGVLTDERIDWIAANFSGVSISFDGLPSVHDRHRPLVSGKGSSHLVLHTLHRFDERKFPYGIRVTVVSEHIPSLPASVEYICSHSNAKSIQVEPVYLLGRGMREASAETDDFIAAFRRAQECASRYDRSIFFSGARAGSLLNHFCCVSQDNFCLSADGNVTGCHEAFSEESPLAEIFFYGKPAPGPSGYQFDRNVLQHLRDQAVENREYCRTCFAKWSCGGDCFYKWRAGSDGGEFNGSARCHIIRELTKDQILEKIEVSGGLVWHDSQEQRNREPENES